MNPETLKKLNLLIDALPKDEKGLVQYLKDAGIKGMPGNARACPLANLLNERGIPASVNTTISVGNTQIDAPDHWVAFVRHFDSGNYAELSIAKPKPVFKSKPIYTSTYYDKW